QGSADASGKQIRVTFPARLRGDRRRATASLEPLDEVFHVRGKGTILTTPEADVEVVPFAHAPSVAFEIAAEVQRRPSGGDVAGKFGWQPQFQFLRNDQALRPVRSTDHLRDRTEMSSGTDHGPSLDLVVRDPGVASTDERPQRRFREQARSRA